MTGWRARLVGGLLAGFAGTAAADQEAGTTPPNWAESRAVQVFVPGFSVRELPLALTNVNNVEYAPDGRLFAAGYDGRMHLLRDTDGDGLEDRATPFFDKKTEDYPLGVAFRGGALYVAHRYQIVRYDDPDGDGLPDRREAVATWEDPALPKALLDPRRVGGMLGLAVGPDGSLYTSTGSLNTFNAYMLAGADGTPPKPEDRGKPGLTSRYDLKQEAGAVLRFAPGAKRPEVVATGVRYLTSLRFNRRGDLFATEQEGATWVPNGNPFDEFLRIQAGRHYGFPARHPKYLPGVVDEPSVFDYAPQHQSTCGFRFNDGAAVWGPAFWEGDAVVTGESRGKLFRTTVVETPAGYVGRNQVIAALGMLPVDVALSPAGDLVVACHSGEPDWGTGPGGRGRLYKIRYDDPAAPQPVAVWAASPTETWVAFDKPLDPVAWKDLRTGTKVEGGRSVVAGDRHERFRPGYAVVQRQGRDPRRSLPVLSAALGEDGRSVLLRTPPRTAAVSYSVALPSPGSPGDDATHKLPRAGGIDLGFDLSGVRASWTSAAGAEEWSGWLPHLDWTVASALTAQSAAHDRLRSLVATPGVLTLTGQLDLGSMLHPAVQPGSTLDFAYPPEAVTVAFEAGTPLTLTAPSPARAEAAGGTSARLSATTTPGARPFAFTLTVATGGKPLALAVTWNTADDPRPRALALRRTLLPWATADDPPAGGPAPAPPEVAGGDWAAGKALFFGPKLNCGTCHTIRGEGGAIGPELTNLIHRDYPSVLKDVTRPSAAINPDFLSYAIELKDGRVMAGVLNGSTDAVLKVAGADGKTVTVPRDDVAAVSPSKTSLMPERLLDGLTEGQVRDLMAYLLVETGVDPKR